MTVGPAVTPEYRPQPPTFGQLLRRLRDDRRISRERLAFAAGVSASYLTLLERGQRDRPTDVVVEALVRQLDTAGPLSDADRRNLLDLAGLPRTCTPSADELRAELTPDMHTGLALFAPNPAAYYDIRLNLLACNEPYATALPGLTEAGNWVRWIFGADIAKQVMVEWELETAITVSRLRGVLGAAGNPDWSADLIADYGDFPRFRELWRHSAASFSRSEIPVRLRDLATGTVTTYYSQSLGALSTNHPGWICYVACVPMPPDDPRASGAGTGYPRGSSNPTSAPPPG